MNEIKIKLFFFFFYYICIFSYPYYVSSPNISIYLYNIVKYAYVSTKNYTNLSTSLGGVEVAVDDSWFLNSLSPGSQNQTVTTYLYILPSTMDPYTELANSNSMYPRPFNFSVLRKYR
jgi:hypothetical protein